jgi:hypothetical protein
MMVCINFELPFDSSAYLISGECLDDLFVLDPLEFQWKDLSSSVGGSKPPALAHQSLTALGGRLYVYGGSCSTGV